MPAVVDGVTSAVSATGTTPGRDRPPRPRRAGIGKRIGPHTLRRAFITAALDTGVPLVAA